MKPYWEGVFPAITTQMKKDGALDLDATARHATALIESGVAGVICLGSLGENQSLAAAQRRGRNQHHRSLPLRARLRADRARRLHADAPDGLQVTRRPRNACA